MSFELKYRQTRQNFRHCSDDDTFYFRFDILLNLSPKCIHKGAIDIRPSLVQIMAGRPIDDEPLPDAIVNLRPRCATIRVLSCYCNWENEAMIRKWCILSKFHWRLLGSNLQQISIASGPLWRHQTETFFALLSLCVGNPPGTGGFPSQRAVTRTFDVSLLSVWTNCWTNTRLPGNARRHDVTVMHAIQWWHEAQGWPTTQL